MSESAVIVKCVVWDLDNTLWQGILLEDGPVRLSDSVWELIRELDARGILQSVASKNDYDHAWPVLQELGVAEYFVLPRIGWGPKSESVRQIAAELNFAHNTMAFVDDQRTERAEVAFHLPEVRCYPAEQLLELAGLAEFSPTTVTVDSRRRRKMYQAGFRRHAAQLDYVGPDEDFLRSLKLTMTIQRADPEELFRVEELTLRTSQMNATGVHYSDTTLRALLDDPDHEVLVVSLSDRFGPHGAIGVLLLEKHPQVWHLKLLATSCRVVSFGVGTAILNWLINQAALVGVHLAADFKPTDRNRIMDIAYRFAGFTDDTCSCKTSLTPGTDIDGLHQFHLIPEVREQSTTLQLTAPDLATPPSVTLTS